MTLDYFLYDNRTFAPRIGRDWGVKAATGALATRSDLRALFQRYCAALSGDAGCFLRRFGEALGGVGSPAEGGYLLCITLETPDPFGRPSWAAYGLWCPTVAVLEDVLAGDPVSSAQEILGMDQPPQSIPLKSGFSLLPKFRRTPSHTTFRRFEKNSAVSEATAILLGAIRAKTKLPDILGITSSSHPAELEKNFDLIYCHPLDERSEQAFARLESENDVVDDEQAPSPSRTTPRALSNFSLTAATILVAIVLVIAADAWPQWVALYATYATQPASGSPEALLADVRARVDEIQRLDPDALREAILTRDTDEKHEASVRAAYASLAEVRERIVGRAKGDSVAHYCDAPQDSSLHAAAKLQKIRLILDEGPLGSEACKVIRDIDPTNKTPTVRDWCDSVVKLEHTAQTLRQASDVPRRITP